MVPVSIGDIVQTTLSSVQASVSVLLVLAYGYLTRKYEYLSQEGEHNISKLSVTFFLPSLLFSQIGPLATPSNLASYWIIIVLSLLNQGIAFLFGLLGTKAFGFPQWTVPCLIFNNILWLTGGGAGSAIRRQLAIPRLKYRFPDSHLPSCKTRATSLPLLLLDTLAKTPSSSLADLFTYPGDTVAEVVKRGRVYFLVNALVANLVRFGFGPYLMRDQPKAIFSHLESPHEIGIAAKDALRTVESVASEAIHSLPTIGARLRFGHDRPGSSSGSASSIAEAGYPDVRPYPAVETTDESAPLLSREGATTSARKLKTTAARWFHTLSTPFRWLNTWMNPPMWGGAAACVAGLTPFLRGWLFGAQGWARPFTTSVENLGGLYTVLQMFVLGAHLRSKKGTRPPLLPMIYLFAFRFFLAPTISGGLVIAVRKLFEGVVREDKVLDFCLVLSPGGPPALTLAAIAEMSGEGDTTQSAVAQTILISYLLTPLISLSVAGAMEVVNQVYGRIL